MANSDSIEQNANNIGKNALQVGGDYTQTTSINLNLLISVFFISVLALGGLAWAINVGWEIPGGGVGAPAEVEGQ
ncbi:MAG: hypothetical protein AAGA83_16175 [Cyanobacteria bacterium P01_F01_bin.116]